MSRIDKPERSDALKKRELSEEDRIALAKYVRHYNRKEYAKGLGKRRFLPIDLVTSSKDSNPLLSHSPLEIAMLNQYWVLVSSMLSELRSTVDTVDRDEKKNMQFIFSKCLLMAAFYRQSALVSEFLSLGADPNRVVSRNAKFDGCGPLHFAIEDQSVSTIEALIAANADPLLATDKAPSALDYAVHLARYYDPDYWLLIPRLLTLPIQESTMKEVEKTYARVLLLAAVYNRTEVVKHLLSVNTDPNLVFVEENVKNAKNNPWAGWLALHFAHRHNNKAMAFYLLAAGADPDIAASNGTTFRSLVVGDYHFDLMFVADKQDLKKQAKRLMSLHPEILTSKRIGEPSLFEQAIDVVSSVREGIFSFFGLSTGTAIDALTHKTDHQQYQIGRHDGQIGSLTDRVGHLETTVNQSKKQEPMGATMEKESPSRAQSPGMISEASLLISSSQRQGSLFGKGERAYLTPEIGQTGLGETVGNLEKHPLNFSHS